MKPDDLFTRLLQRFDCAFKQTLARNLTPSMQHWNLTLSPATETFHIVSEVPLQLTNPFSIILEGRKMNRQVFGSAPAKEMANNYIRNHYPYMQLERTFLLPLNTLATVFWQGLNASQTSPRASPYKGSTYHETEYMMAYDCGKFIMSKYFGCNMLFNQLPFMKNL